MNQIDVHILHMPNENQNWWEECKQSLNNHPINIHELSAIEGDQWTARLNGFRAGNAPYISFVDPDDVVKPDIFQKCLDILESNPNICGVYTNSEIVDEKGKVIGPRLMNDKDQWTMERHLRLPTPVHQIAVMRRDVFEQAIELIGEPLNTHGLVEFMIFSYIAVVAPWYFLDEIGYQWRRHNDGVHHCMKSPKRNQVRNAIRNRIKELINESN